MKLLRFLLPKAYRKARFHLRPNSKHEVDLVFEVNGVEYWKFVNELNIPVERAFAAMDIYAELEEKADSVYTETAFKAIEEYLKKGENIKAGIVANAALERKKHITNLDLVYKLASVLYFDTNENIYSYDVEYNRKKIDRWKKSGSVESFFLRTPLKEYVTLFNGSEMSLQTYIRAQREETVRMLRFHLASFSENEKQTDLYSQAVLQVETLEELLKLEK